MRARALLVVVLVCLAAVLTGCLADLQRTVLDTSWEAEAELHDGPVASVDGQPAMLQVQGPLGLPDGVAVELTGIVGHLTVDGDERGLTPAHVRLGDATIAPSEVDDDKPELTDGLDVGLTFVPSPGTPDRVSETTNLSVEVELQYRYKEGDRFDAGTFTFEGNVSLADDPGLGVGVAEVREGSVRSLVFDAIGRSIVAGPGEVVVHEVTGGGPERIGTVNATLEPGVGVLRVALEEPVDVPQGDGYLLLRLAGGPAQTLDGVATQGFEPGEDPAPGFGLGLLIVATAGALVAARRAHTP